MPGRPAPSRALVAALALLWGGSACVPLPFRVGPALSGTVVDAHSGEPLAGAVVVVEVDSRVDDVLPAPELLGFSEARTDDRGRFRTPRVVKPGLSIWPWEKTRAHLVTALQPGYRCSGAAPLSKRTLARIELEPAGEPAARDSCRPAGAAPGDLPVYTAAWNALHGTPRGQPDPATGDPSLERMLAARRAFGFGRNCRGPVHELALSPRGDWVAVVREGARGREIQVIAAGAPGARPVSTLPLPASGGILWGESGTLAALPSDPLAEAVPLWSPGPLPASLGEGGSAPRPDLARNDASDHRWMGRSFTSIHDLDPETGLPRERLRISEAGRPDWTLDLPGESCRPAGDPGGPHHRLSRDGTRGLDLRFVDGGCHAVAIDLASGAWERLDVGPTEAQCRSSRRVPASHFATALRGYLEQIETRLAAAGLDPAAAFTLELDAERPPRIRVTDPRGRSLRLEVPPFPLATPLRRIEVSVVGPPQQTRTPAVRSGPEQTRTPAVRSGPEQTRTPAVRSGPEQRTPAVQSPPPGGMSPL